MAEHAPTNPPRPPADGAFQGLHAAPDNTGTLGGDRATQRSRASDCAPKPLAVSIDHAGVMLGVSRRTVYRLIGLGHLNTVRVLRAVRVPVQSIQSLIARGGVE